MVSGSSVLESVVGAISSEAVVGVVSSVVSTVVVVVKFSKVSSSFRASLLLLSVIKGDLLCTMSLFSSRRFCCTSSSPVLSLRREISFCRAIVMDLVMRRHGGVVLVISFLNDSPLSLELSGPLFSSAVSPPLLNSSTSPCSLPSISAISLSSSSSLLSSSLPFLLGSGSFSSSATVADVA